MIKFVLIFWLGLLSSASASPFLISDPYVVQSDPNLNPVQFVIHGITANDVTVNATTLSSGNLVLQYDLSTLPNGTYSVSAAALNVFGGESPFSSPPFAFTKGVPAPPSNLRISPTMLVWVPTFGGTRQSRQVLYIPSLPASSLLLQPPRQPKFQS